VIEDVKYVKAKTCFFGKESCTKNKALQCDAHFSIVQPLGAWLSCISILRNGFPFVIK